MVHKIRIGADPELFVFSKATGLPVSAHDLIPGTKDEPYRVPSGAIQVDGVAAEFNIDPAATVSEFTNNIFLVKSVLWRNLRAKNEDYVLRAFPAVSFTRKIWESIPEEAKQLGCTPDYSAYTLAANPAPDSKQMMRTGSGHIHVSWTEEPARITREYVEHVADLVRHLDTHLYPQSRKWDNDEKRRKLYGEIGAFRPKTYGVEYRVLSNKWLDSLRTQEYVFNATKYITERWLAGMKAEDYLVPDYVA